MTPQSRAPADKAPDMKTTDKVVYVYTTPDKSILLNMTRGKKKWLPSLSHSAKRCSQQRDSVYNAPMQIHCQLLKSQHTVIRVLDHK